LSDAPVSGCFQAVLGSASAARGPPARLRSASALLTTAGATRATRGPARESTRSDGDRDVYDPADAIPPEGPYLRGAGAPDDDRRGSSRITARLVRRPRPRGGALPRRGGETSGSAGTARGVPFGGTWLSPVPGTGLRCDGRIVPDVRVLIAHFGLRLTACFAGSKPRAAGEHPRGLAVDVVPGDGNRNRTMRVARPSTGRRTTPRTGVPGARSCASSLYNGFPGHGARAFARRRAVRRICTFGANSAASGSAANRSSTTWPGVSDLARGRSVVRKYAFARRDRPSITR
jgi:hypothetical protein